MATDFKKMKDPKTLRKVFASYKALTRVSLDVCADTAVKGDWSGSGTSMMEKD